MSRGDCFGETLVRECAKNRVKLQESIRLLALAGLLLILCTSQLHAQQAEAPGAQAQARPTATVDREADHQALRELLKKVELAINAQDAEAMRQCLAEQFFLITTDQRVITSFDELKAYYEEIFKADDAPVESMSAKLEADILTRFIDDSTGICYGTTTEHYNLRGGKRGSITSRWTAVCSRASGEWRVVAAHAGVDFLDNPVLAHTRRSSMMLTTAASVVSLLLGALISHLVFRRPGRS